MIDAPTFQSLRQHLFSVAYRMLGSAAEAEDVVQDAWLRAGAAPSHLESARAWLTTVTTRLCLDRLKSARARREEYVGPWLPEPVPAGAIETAEDTVARRESVTLAFLVLLETLSPAERAAFLLREIFDRDYSEVAQVLETSEAAARQLVHRAKSRIAEGRTRFDAPPLDRQQEIVARFMDAVQQNDLASLERLLAADVVFTSDGGGKVAAATRPVLGADSVARLILGLWKKALEALEADPSSIRTALVELNGEPALTVRTDGTLTSVFVFSTDTERISAVRVMRNPDKLAWLESHV